eukprot:CAMPEP_0181293988 /NCGR_PEP_ID=MMETSP1101-20121128/3357_1 /TAXON_ID=46948 /ORGANISM="Rhodomonas abbreviata, Strain Caron Lab Isolate" /LENGTH=441 /DNA_ID=CAMNT_0023398609 /DNA_START=237 /DNA_END=1559 /DNA_ORIENTATION=-
MLSMSALCMVMGSAVAFIPAQPGRFSLRQSHTLSAQTHVIQTLKQGRSSSRRSLLRCAVVDGVTGNVGEQLLDRENAHVVGLLQNPFDASGSSGAFPGLPEHLSRMVDPPVPDNTPKLDPWGEKSGFPERCPEDPFGLVREELSPFAESIKSVVDTDHPILSEAAKHFFAQRQGKRFRPTIVMLMSKATSPSPTEHISGSIYDKQALLGQVTEMIHVASLIHDDVLDEADTRRGGEAVHKLYTNKVAVIAGDYLLARASVLLAKLQNTEVTEIMSTALESLVQGEIMQIKTGEEDLLDMMTYLRKSYHKTASLICDASKSAAMLGGHAADSEQARAAEEYGYHLGLAYQIIDDVLDFTGASDVLGKPALADVSLGLSTAPVLFASESIPELRPMIKRKFKQDGDVEKTLTFVLKSDGVERARELALFHAQRAVNAIARLPE